MWHKTNLSFLLEFNQIASQLFFFFACARHIISLRGRARSLEGNSGAHPQAIQDVDEIVSLLEQIWRNVTLHDLLGNGSSAVNVWVQKADKNITIIHITSVHQLISCEVKICMFIRNILASNHVFGLYPIMLLSPVITSESGNKYAQIKHSL